MLMLALLAATVSPGDGKTMMSDDWQQLAIYGVGGGGGDGLLYVQVHAGDLDGDGVPDDAILKLQCADGQVVQALLRRETSGLESESERRQHAPVTFVKEWRMASTELTALKPTYDVKTLKGNEKRTTGEGWMPLTLGQSDGLCAAAAKAVKTRSNIQNN